MNKTLSFSEVLNVEELAPTELDAIVGGKFGIKSLVLMVINAVVVMVHQLPLLPLRILLVQLILKYFISR